MQIPKFQNRGATIAGYLLFAILTVADVVSSKLIFAAGGVELNPVLSPISDQLVAVKALALVGVTLWALWCEKKYPGAGYSVFWAAALITLLPVWANLRELVFVGVI